MGILGELLKVVVMLGLLGDKLNLQVVIKAVGATAVAVAVAETTAEVEALKKSARSSSATSPTQPNKNHSCNSLQRVAKSPISESTRKASPT